MTTTLNASNSGSGGLVATADASGVLALQTAGTTAVTVDTSQNVGIGTTTPSSYGKLTVNDAGAKSIYVRSSSTNYSGLLLENTNSATKWQIGVEGGAFNTAGLLNIGIDGVGSKMAIDSSGNVGIGTTSPNYRLNVGDTSSVTTLNGAGITLFTSGSLTSNIGGVLNFRPGLGTTASDIFNLSICAYDHSGDTNADGLSINGSDGISFCTGGNSRNERARFTSDGRFYVNQTAGNGNTAQRMGLTYNGASEWAFAIKTTEATGGNAISFQNSSGTQVGVINQTNTATSYITSSDYRLKEDIAPMTGALAKVALLKPVTYKWKSDGSDAEGFIAHELAEVCPAAVHGVKDAINKEGNPEYQGIDTSFLVATLTAAIQEQQTLITSLTARIAALEGTPA